MERAAEEDRQEDLPFRRVERHEWAGHKQL
jgi:hypothetical protein